MLRIALVALENVLPSTIAGPLDIFAVSCRLRQTPDQGAPFCEVAIISPGCARVRDTHGMPLLPTAAETSGYDIVILPATYGEIAPNLENRGLIDWLRDQHRQGSCICTICAGAFLAAEAGLLDGRTATTHWALAADFRHRFPKVRLQAERILVDLGDIITAGGVTSYLDLCLHLLQRFGSQELAAEIARIFLIDTNRRDQLPYMASSFAKNHGDRQILACQEWLETHGLEPLSTAQMAARAGLQERTFTRRFKRATGITPSGYLRNLRIEAARRLLERTREPLESVTRLVGYEDFSSFRRLFIKHTGLTPSAYRQRFSLIAR